MPQSTPPRKEEPRKQGGKAEPHHRHPHKKTRREPKQKLSLIQIAKKKIEKIASNRNKAIEDTRQDSTPTQGRQADKGG